MAKEFSRILTKRSFIPGVVPTIPASNDLNFFTGTDIFEGELFLNLPDGKLYTREGNNIILLVNAIPNTGETITMDYKTLATQSTPVTISNTSVESVFPTTLAVTPDDNLIGGMYELHYNVSKGPAGHTSTFRVYVNTQNNLTGAVKLLENSNGFNSNTSFSPFFRYFRNSIGLVIPRDVNAGQTVWSNIQTQSLTNTTPITFSNANTYYFIITTQMNVANSSETLQFAKLCLVK